jgi:hypothetical protein
LKTKDFGLFSSNIQGRKQAGGNAMKRKCHGRITFKPYNMNQQNLPVSFDSMIPFKLQGRRRQ